MNNKHATDEQAAVFADEMTEKEHFELQGASVYIGRHPSGVNAVVISPLMGDHLILTYPFAGENALL